MNLQRKFTVGKRKLKLLAATLDDSANLKLTAKKEQTKNIKKHSEQ